MLHLRVYSNYKNAKSNNYVNSEWRMVITIINIRCGKKHSMWFICHIEFTALEIRKTKPVTSMLANTYMDIILRITMELPIYQFFFVCDYYNM